jgi:hypothetical protein
MFVCVFVVCGVLVVCVCMCVSMRKIVSECCMMSVRMCIVRVHCVSVVCVDECCIV